MPKRPPSWSTVARPIVAAVLAATAGQPEKEIRKALTAAYPFGTRRYWPYKAWLSEVKRQRKKLAGRDDFACGSLFEQEEPEECVP